MKNGYFKSPTELPKNKIKPNESTMDSWPNDKFRPELVTETTFLDL